ncbi:transposase [Pseudarthrobacter sp. NPDC057230]|uniref:transposase n=1 Tax=Micrococcaceae TaxID=1268 RepID=UPI003639D130
MLIETGPSEIEVPRDRDGTSEPVIAPKRKRHVDGVDQIVLTLPARRCSAEGAFSKGAEELLLPAWQG